MKPLIITLSILVVLGLLYGLAFFGILPAQKWADGSPALAKTLIAMHLARVKRPKPPAAATSAAPSPEQQALASQKKQMQADRTQLAKDREAFETEKQQAAARSAAAPASDGDSKLAAIYATMSPDDIARIFGKLPDKDVVDALTQMDEKKAGKILAALAPERAAKISLLLTRSGSGHGGSAASATLLHSTL